MNKKTIKIIIEFYKKYENFIIVAIVWAVCLPYFFM